jgi:hypothetical protein
MKTIETTAIITADGKLHLEVPTDMPAGERKVVLIVGETVAETPKPKKKNFTVSNL